MEGVMNMPEVIIKGIGINPFESQTEHERMRNSFALKKSPKKSKNSELTKIMGIKNNNNLYIPLQIIFQKRRCL